MLKADDGSTEHFGHELSTCLNAEGLSKILRRGSMKTLLNEDYLCLPSCSGSLIFRPFIFRQRVAGCIPSLAAVTFLFQLF